MYDKQNARGKERKYQKRLPRNTNYGQIDYIDYLSLSLTEEKCSDFIENANFGFEYENTICTKSCINLKIKSINEKRLYTRRYKHFFGLKLILIKKVNNLPVDYIERLLDEGKYKVVAFSNNYTKISCGNINYYISYNGEGLYLYDEYYCEKKLMFLENHKKALINSVTSYSDKYQGTFMFKMNNEILLYLILYSSSAEVDGVFDVLSNIELSEYKADIIYKNYIENNIKDNSLLIYEIKSGDKQMELINQMKKRCHFIVNYIKLIYKDIQHIYYFGFFKEDDNFEVISNKYDSIENIKKKAFDKNEELKQDNYSNKKESLGGINNTNKEENDSYEKQDIYSSKNTVIKEGNNPNMIKVSKKDKNSDLDRFEELQDQKKKNFPSKEESKQYQILKEDPKEVNYSIEKENSYSDIHCEEKTKENSCGNSVDKNEQENNQINIDSLNKNKFENKRLKDFKFKKKELDKLPAKIVIFKLKNTIFGENLKYDGEELNLISNLKDDIHSIKRTNNILNEKMNSIEGKTDSMKREIDSMKDKIDSMKVDIDTMKGDIDTMKGDIDTMKGDIDSMKGQITDMKSEFSRKFQLLFDKFGIQDNSQLSINEK